MPSARNTPAATNEALRMFVVPVPADILTKTAEERSIAAVTFWQGRRYSGCKLSYIFHSLSGVGR
jgi:hypothetical protein